MLIILCLILTAGRIEYASFIDFTVDYGGICFVNQQIDFVINCVQISKITSTSFFSHRSEPIGGSCFIFIGKNFIGSRICGSELKNKNMVGNIITYSNSDCNNILNFSCFSSCEAYQCPLLIGYGNINSNDVNATEMKFFVVRLYILSINEKTEDLRLDTI